jgi:integrase
MSTDKPDDPLGITQIYAEQPRLVGGTASTGDAPTNTLLDAANAAEPMFETSRRFTEAAALAAFTELAPGKSAALLHARSARSWLQYASAVRVFRAWCDENGHVALPASPATFCAWIEAMISGQRTIATIASYRAAIATWHRLNSHKLDLSLASEWMRAARRQSGPPRRAAALRAQHLREILATLDPAIPADARDGALLTLAWGAALRSDELTALDWQREGAHHVGGKGAAILEPCGVRVTLRRSKTTTNVRSEIPIPHRDLPDLREWLLRWVELGGITAGTPLFRPIAHGIVRPARLGSAAVTHVLRRRALRAALARGDSEIEARIAVNVFTSHSARRGVITEGVERGVPFSTLRRRSRHRSDQQLVAYVDDAQAWTDSGIRWGKP